MKKILTFIILNCLSFLGIAQNVGIGTITPATKLTVTIPTTGFVMEHNSATSPVVIKSYLGSGVAQIGTYSNHPFDIMANNGSAQLRLMPTGLVGIGEANPDLAGLVVNKAVGNTYGIFGGNTTGVSLIGGWPGVGFNTYFNGGNSKFMAAGFAGQIGFSPVDGQFIFSSSSVAGTASAVATLNSRIGFYPDGGMAVNGPNAAYVFKDRTLTDYAGWGWYANNGSANLYRYTSGGDVMTIGSTGNVGINNTSPSAKLDVRSNSSTYAAYVGQSGTGTGFGVVNGSSTSAALYASNGSGPAIIADGSVGIGNIFPKAGLFLDVKGRMRVKGIANDVNNTAGIYFDGTTAQQRSFIGMLNNDKVGIYGDGGAGWSTVMDVNTGNFGIGTTTPNSKLQVSGGVSLPYKFINDNYTATDDDYSIRFAPTASSGQYKTVTMPSAVGRTGRVYVISTDITFTQDCNNWSRLYIKSEFGTNIITDSPYMDGAGSGFDALMSNRQVCLDNTGPGIRKLSVTLQSNGTVWKIIDADFISF